MMTKTYFGRRILSDFRLYGHAANASYRYLFESKIFYEDSENMVENIRENLIIFKEAVNDIEESISLRDISLLLLQD
jgi:hypothetical protein